MVYKSFYMSTGLTQLLLQLPFLRKEGHLPRPRFGRGEEGVGKVFRLMLPAIFGVSVAQINVLVNTLLASFLVTGSISWLSGVDIVGDDTDGHIDQQIRFAETDCVILAKGYAPEDPVQPGFEAMIEELRSTFGGQRPLQGMDLPLPPPIQIHGRRIPASYLNFYICNYGVIVPQFNSPLADARAVDLLTAAFPGRRVIGLPSLNLACGLGSFHCLTQQQPAV